MIICAAAVSVRIYGLAVLPSGWSVWSGEISSRQFGSRSRKRPAGKNCVGVRRGRGLVDGGLGNAMAAERRTRRFGTHGPLYAGGDAASRAACDCATLRVRQLVGGRRAVGNRGRRIGCLRLLRATRSSQHRTPIQDRPPSLWRMPDCLWPGPLVLSCAHGRTGSQVAPAGTNILGLRHSGRTFCGRDRDPLRHPRAHSGHVVDGDVREVFGILVHAPTLFIDPHTHFNWAANAINFALIGSAWVIAASITAAVGKPKP